jgi:hypothetical protein
VWGWSRVLDITTAKRLEHSRGQSTSDCNHNLNVAGARSSMMSGFLHASQV